MPSADLVPLLMMHVNTPPPPPWQKNRRLPPALDAVILELLAKDPGQRYQGCRGLAQEPGRIRDAVA